ncbi:ubiquitination-mediated degradation component [Theileria orientalis strain Shintoku]|uniref:RING-type E3 ubiquitin transferase n=1 Tax=Theileria orientalis strain Shintoku TaxID=869250 RepID=J4D633_THEOR|nr:ubiquitination-mediated degradation component [Theileria orientalis strain Shintoku]BAM39305.1 ubiquitination-mediated degradation component [Theileria orientalis strain Shintoku]|eukprot:XP_009689606.1 ubiquitination-mediated degradation component [Theileria orientalis strain Shintoku]
MPEDAVKVNILHTLIQNVLNITIRKSERSQAQPNQSEQPKLYVGHLYGRVSGVEDTENKYLGVEDLDDVVRSVIYVCILHNKNVLVNLNDSYTRISNGITKISKGQGLSQLFKAEEVTRASSEPLKSELISALENVQATLVANASLIMIFPIYFNLTDVINESEIKRAYLDVLDEKVLSEVFLDFATSTHNSSFLQNMTTAMWESDSNAAKVSYTNVFNMMRVRMAARGLKSSSASEVKFLTEALGCKPVAELFLENIRKFELEQPFFKSCGVKRELMTIFGRMLSVTSLDEEAYQACKLLGLKNIYEASKVDRTSDFYGKRDLNHIKSVINAKRFEAEHAMNGLLQMLKVILKSDAAARNEILSILGRIVAFNVNRKKIYGLTNIDSAPFSMDSMYYHKLVMISDNTFGYGINLTWLLLLLAQGISVAKADEIEPSYCQTASMASRKLKSLKVKPVNGVAAEATSEGAEAEDAENGTSGRTSTDTQTASSEAANTLSVSSAVGNTQVAGTTTLVGNRQAGTSAATVNTAPGATTAVGNTEGEAYMKEQLTKIETEMTNILGFLCNSSCMGDENDVREALRTMGVDAVTLYNSKFITQIFWLTLKGVNMLFMPALQENLKLLTQALNYASTSQNLSANDDKLANYISHVYVWRTPLQHPALLKALWHYVNIALRVFLRCFLLYDAKGGVKEDYKGLYDSAKGKFSALVEKYCEHVLDTDKAAAPPQFTALPVELIETVLDLVKNMTILRQYDHYIKPAEGDPLEGMDFELVISACIFIMKCPNDVIKNIHIKCDMACSTILYLCKFSEQSAAKFENSSVCKQHLMDALVRTFISSQKSNYNTRISSRLNIIQSFTQFFVHASYKRSFVSCIISKKDLFVQFMHLLLNDTNFLVEEVVSYLTEIRRREVAGISLEEAPGQAGGGDQQGAASGASGSGGGSSSSSAARNPRGQDYDDADQYVQEGAIDANQLKSMSGPELKSRTRSFVEYGFEICSLLNILCSEFPSDITSSSVLLPQVATCLGCCLESLAGPKCLQLKVKNMDEYGFKPREWLSKIMKCYIALYENDPDSRSTASSIDSLSSGSVVGTATGVPVAGVTASNATGTITTGVTGTVAGDTVSDVTGTVAGDTGTAVGAPSDQANSEENYDYEDENNPFVKAVVADERYYKPELFTRCVRFATREMLLSYKSIKSFNKLANRLLEHAKRTSLLYENASNAEIPEHFLDPIMMDVMEDPVLLPTSGKVMDRKNIERHLMSEATDPFTRAPLDRSQLVDQPDLKREIVAFLRSLSRSSA